MLSQGQTRIAFHSKMTPRMRQIKEKAHQKYICPSNWPCQKSSGRHQSRLRPVRLYTPPSRLSRRPAPFQWPSAPRESRRRAAAPRPSRDDVEAFRRNGAPVGRPFFTSSRDPNEGSQKSYGTLESVVPAGEKSQ